MRVRLDSTHSVNVLPEELVVEAAVVPIALARPLITVAMLELSPALEAGICAILVVGVICLVAVRPVREPRRAVIYRLATLHRVAGPGYVWLLPFLDRIEQQISMGEHEALIQPAGARTEDCHLLKARLEVTWRLASSIRGRPSEAERQTLLLPDERRAKLVEEAITRAGARVIGRFTLAALSSAEVRDEAVAQVTADAGRELAVCGIEVQRIFWRL